jgi:hypothetical protein
MKCTQAQLDALYEVYLLWQSATPHAIMPDNFEIVPDDDLGDGYYIGAWVGGDIPTRRKSLSTGAIYLGIEKDGHTHS